MVHVVISNSASRNHHPCIHPMLHSQSEPVDRPKVRFSCDFVPSIDIDLLNHQKMRLPLPPLETDGRVCFYGFAVTTEWLVDYANTHWNNAGQYDKFAKVSTAIKLLRRESSIQGLQFEAALVDRTVPPETILIPGHRSGELMVPLLAICSNEAPSYKKRPSQAQVAQLSELMGGKQPRWWVDYEDPRSYAC